ncbi:Gfo/Idh/MocA family oxidoreductase [Spirosoma telluris]|uniref:Gfo/Idh/MocA family oxidoreductase n=1 Tax=Spirosoma telluris TaxID=2183553 RepID=UPI002FC30900
MQPNTRDSEMSCILRGTEGCSQADYMDLRYAITTNTGDEIIQTWEHKLKHYFRFEGKSHHAGEYQNYLDYFATCLESGQTAYPDIREGIGTVALLQSMDKSLQTGQPVKVQEVLREHGL